MSPPRESHEPDRSPSQDDNEASRAREDSMFVSDNEEDADDKPHASQGSTMGTSAEHPEAGSGNSSGDATISESRSTATDPENRSPAEQSATSNWRDKFVFQADGTIDLTGETEADDEARRKRVNRIPVDLSSIGSDAPLDDMVNVKQEIVDENHSTAFAPATGTGLSRNLDGMRQTLEGHDPAAMSGQDSEYEDDTDLDFSDGGPSSKRRRHSKKSTNKGKESEFIQERSGAEAPRSVAGGESSAFADEFERLERLTFAHEQLVLKRSTRTLIVAERLELAKLKGQIRALEQKFEAIEGDEIEQGEDDIEGDVEMLSASERRTAPTPSVAAKIAEGPEAGENSMRTQQQKRKRRLPDRTHRDYWARQYKNHGVGANDPVKIQGKWPASVDPKSAGKRRSKASKRLPIQTKLMEMLRNDDPLAARAAMGEVNAPGPIQAKYKKDQWAQILSNIENNPNKKDAKKQQKLLDEASRSFGYGNCKARDGMWQLPGMKSHLYNHQLVGVRWMCGQELSPNGPYGGILADGMGLGKTIEVLATATINQPDEEELRDWGKTTLIVAPATAISQWISEIKAHCTHPGKIMHFKASQGVEKSIWTDVDFLLASYNEIAKAYPTDEVLRNLSNMELNDQEWAKVFEEELGALYTTKFLRVVLDEGHAIKNQFCRTSRACIQLSSKYRWAVTGTPIMNSPNELYPYLKFIGSRWAGSFEEFRKNFGNLEDIDAGERVSAAIQSNMLRRHAHESFAGRLIVEIPQTHKLQHILVDLSEEERLIYRRLEGRFRDNLNLHIGTGQVSGKMRSYTAYLTRLRQATAHPFLLEGALATNFTLDDFAWLRAELRNRVRKEPLHEQIGKWVEMEYDNRTNSSDFGKGRFGFEFDMDPHLEAMEQFKSLDDLTCKVCYDIAVQPLLTKDCGHVFCTECLQSLIERAKEDSLIEMEAECKCPACGTILVHKPTILTNPDPPAERPGNGRANQPHFRKKPRKPDHNKKREPGDDFLGIHPKLFGPCSWLTACDEDPSQSVVPSAKTTAVKNQILKWQAEAPDDKIIVFVLWMPTAGILGRMLMEEKIEFLYYVGSVDHKTRGLAVDAFKTNPDIKVMIVSVKAGGVALNLTAANRVILVDLWWNKEIENQAFSRVHRIGQRKPTYFAKILTRNTVDEFLCHMQERKEKMVNKLLGSKANLTVDDLKRLFDSEGREAKETSAVDPMNGSDDGAPAQTHNDNDEDPRGHDGDSDMGGGSGTSSNQSGHSEGNAVQILDDTDSEIEADAEEDYEDAVEENDGLTAVREFLQGGRDVHRYDEPAGNVGDDNGDAPDDWAQI